MIRVLTPLLIKRISTFYQLIKTWSYFQFTFDIITPISYQLICFQLSLFLHFRFSFFLCLALALEVKRLSVESHPFPLSRSCQRSDCGCTGLARLGSAGLQWAAVRHRNNRNLPKASAAKTVWLAKCLLQKTVSSSSGLKQAWKQKRCENVSWASAVVIHAKKVVWPQGSPQQAWPLMLQEGLSGFSGEAEGPDRCCRFVSALVGLSHLLLRTLASSAPLVMVRAGSCGASHCPLTTQRWHRGNTAHSKLFR